ncbi:type II toxin-antitoxin system Phd/YefM family antitoxin [Planctomycetota bacterium]
MTTRSRHNHKAPHVLSVAEVKARFSQCVRTAETGEPVVITRRGHPVAALVGTEQLAQIERLRRAGPGAGLAGLAGGWEDSDRLVDEVLSLSRSGTRSIPALD